MVASASASSERLHLKRPNPFFPTARGRSAIGIADSAHASHAPRFPQRAVRAPRPKLGRHGALALGRCAFMERLGGWGTAWVSKKVNFSLTMGRVGIFFLT